MNDRFSRFLAFLLLLALLPLMLAIALPLFCISGTVFYREKRLGPEARERVRDRW